MSDNQLDLFNWKPRAEILPFPLHRSHGATAGAAKRIIDMATPARTGKLNSIRAQTRKHMELVFGRERAEKIADDLVDRIKTQILYREYDRGVRKPDEI